MTFNQSYKKITSLQNTLVKHLVKVRENARYRIETNSVLITGRKIVQELSKTSIPKRVFFTEGFSLSLPNCHMIEVSDAVLKKITNLATPEGICAEFPLPKGASLEHLKKILALDQINDPGNLGTLIRTAAALGWDGIFFLPNCVDPFHEKVLRASRGALFKVKWQTGEWKELKKLKEKNDARGFIADLNGKKLSEVKSNNRLILLLSNEAAGVSEEGEKFGEKVTIPMPGEMESLNVAVAGGIIMYGLSSV